MFSPQLTDVCLDGSTIIGTGYVTDVVSECSCAASNSAADLLKAGVPTSKTDTLSALAKGLDGVPGWVNSISNTSDTVRIHTLLIGYDACGAVNSSTVPVCLTTVANHTNAELKVEYKTDGSPASIAAKVVTLLSSGDAADISWLQNAAKVILGGDDSSHALPPHWPGAVNPLLWSMTSNTHDVSPSLLEYGMEHSLSYVLRAGIQRTYGTSGAMCAQDVIDPSSTTLNMTALGYSFALAWVIPQLILNFLALVAFMPWMISSYPILPAYEMSKSPIAFTMMATRSRIVSTKMKSLSGNIEDAYMWPRMDVILRLGESVDTVEDMDLGLIVLDKPKNVAFLTMGKEYQ